MPLSAGVLLLIALLAMPATAGHQPDLAAGMLDLDGRPVDPLTPSAGDRAAVLVFVTTDCPISNRYAPEVKRLAREYADAGVRTWLVYPVPGDTPEKIKAHAAAFDLDLPIVRDTARALVNRTGVTVTPEVAVYTAEGEMAYRGRIDDRYVAFGVDRPRPTTRDLEESLAAIAHGGPITPRTTRAIGCFLADLLP
ncbi:MAG: redoxin domain-containing protein [Acidobacteria bacterium]|nr:redoxin domain-containing protein [Acidobacteriota bacterium]